MDVTCFLAKKNIHLDVTSPQPSPAPCPRFLMSDEEGFLSDEDSDLPVGPQIDESDVSLDAPISSGPAGAAAPPPAQPVPYAVDPSFDLEQNKRLLVAAVYEMRGIAFTFQNEMANAGLSAESLVDTIFFFAKEPLEGLLKHLQPIYREQSENGRQALTLTMMFEWLMKTLAIGSYGSSPKEWEADAERNAEWSFMHFEGEQDKTVFDGVLKAIAALPVTKDTAREFSAHLLMPPAVLEFLQAVGDAFSSMLAFYNGLPATDAMRLYVGNDDFQFSGGGLGVQDGGLNAQRSDKKVLPHHLSLNLFHYAGQQAGAQDGFVGHGLLAHHLPLAFADAPGEG